MSSEIINLCCENLVPTYTGKAFDLVNPDPQTICLEDIAHSLSQLCRFTGSTGRLYSVAEHSLMVYRLVDPDNKKWALLHDSAEAYTGDIISPVKRLINGYNPLEERILSVVSKKFDLGKIPEQVLIADKFATIQEGLYFHNIGKWGLFWNLKINEFRESFSDYPEWITTWNKYFKYGTDPQCTSIKREFLRTMVDIKIGENCNGNEN